MAEISAAKVEIPLFRYFVLPPDFFIKSGGDPVYIMFCGDVFGVDDKKDVFEVSVDGSIGTLGATT